MDGPNDRPTWMAPMIANDRPPKRSFSRLGLAPGDRLLSEPENKFDLSGPSPLNPRVIGILRPTGSPDDEIVLCDLKTAWIMQGIGHGHTLKSSPTETTDTSAEPNSHGHNAGRENLAPSAEVTDENLRTIHFHGQTDTFPLMAMKSFSMG